MIELILALLLQLITTPENGINKGKKDKDSDVATTQSISAESTTATKSFEDANTTQYGGTGTWTVGN